MNQWDMIFENETDKNSGFKAFFSAHPEKKKMYIAKLKDSWAPNQDDNIELAEGELCRYCKNCTNKEPNENYKFTSCLCFPLPRGKPEDVYSYGENCYFYIADSDDKK